MFPTVSDMDQVVVAGDQTCTDVVSANTAGTYSILIDPIGKDGIWTRLNLPRRLKELQIRRMLESYYGMM